METKTYKQTITAAREIGFGARAYGYDCDVIPDMVWAWIEAGAKNEGLDLADEHLCRVIEDAYWEGV